MPRVRRQAATVKYTNRHVHALEGGCLSPAFGPMNPPLSARLYPTATIAAARDAWPVLRTRVEASLESWHDQRSMDRCHGGRMRCWAWYAFEHGWDIEGYAGTDKRKLKIQAEFCRDFGEILFLSSIEELTPDERQRITEYTDVLDGE